MLQCLLGEKPKLLQVVALDKDTAPRSDVKLAHVILNQVELRSDTLYIVADGNGRSFPRNAAIVVQLDKLLLPRTDMVLQGYR